MADFWAGAISFNLNKHEPGRWTLDKRFGQPIPLTRSINGTIGRDSGGSTYFISFADRKNAFAQGWMNAEFGDRSWFHYGFHDAA